MAYIKHGVSVGKAIQIYPIELVSGLNQVSCLEISVETGGYIGYGLNKLTNDNPILFANIIYQVNGPQRLLLPAGEEIRIAGR